MIRTSTKVISSFTGSNRFLSNFYPSPIMADGSRYPTVEHAFQAAKTRDKIWRERIRCAATPGDAKRLGRRCPMREDWENAKLDMMEHLLRIKFRAPVLQKRLIETNGSYLIEGNTWGDRYWGAELSPNYFVWEGENHLGLLLMKIRSELLSPG